MKTKIFILILIASFYFGCGEKKGNDPGNITSNQMINYKVGDKFILKMGYKTGEKYNYTISTLENNLQTINNQSQSSRTNINYKLTSEVISKDSSGDFDMKIKINAVKINVDMGPDKNLSFDSENPADTIKRNHPALFQYYALVGNHYFVRVNTRGEIQEIYKVDNIIKTLLGQNAGKVNENQKMQIRLTIESQLRNITQQIFQLLPEAPIHQDSSWRRVYDDKLLGEIDVRNTAIYTLKKISTVNNKEIAYLEASLLAETSGNRSFEKNGVKTSIEKPEIKGGGNIEFDLANGVVVKRDMNTSITLIMNINQAGKTLKVINKVNTQVKIELN